MMSAGGHGIPANEIARAFGHPDPAEFAAFDEEIRDLADIWSPDTAPPLMT